MIPVTQHSTAFQIVDVKKTFDTADGRQVQALDGVSFEVEAGQLVCMVGPTGCGKTTLLRLMAGLETPTGGQILLEGKPVVRPGADRGMVFQQYSLFPWRTVLKNVTFGLEMKGLPKKDQLKRARRAIQQVGLNKFEKAYPYELSGGMQQRVAIARALVNEPQILLMDEPYGSLDESTRLKLQDVLLALCRDHQKTVLFVTHSLDEAVYLSDRVVVLGGMPGQVVGDLTIDMPHPRERVSQQFVECLLHIRQVIADSALNDNGVDLVPVQRLNGHLPTPGPCCFQDIEPQRKNP